MTEVNLYIVLKSPQSDAVSSKFCPSLLFKFSDDDASNFFIRQWNAADEIIITVELLIKYHFHSSSQFAEIFTYTFQVVLFMHNFVILREIRNLAIPTDIVYF